MKKIKIRRGSLEHNALLKMRGEKMEKVLGTESGRFDTTGNIGNRFVYMITPIEGIKLVGSLAFDLYESFESDHDNVPLFYDVYNLEIVMQEIELPDNGITPINGNVKRKTGYAALPHFIKLGRYLASESDVIIELDKSSGIYVAYIQNVSNIQISNIIPGQRKDQ